MTHAQLRQRMVDWMAGNAKRLPPAVCTDILNIQQRDLCRQYDLRYNELQDTLTAIVGTNAYDLPAAWSRPYKLRYVDPESGGVVTVSWLLADEFDNLYPDPTSHGRPKHYTTWNDQLYLGPTPDLIVEMRHLYYGFLADLVADDDSNGLTEHAWDVLLFKSLADLTKYGIEDARIPTWQLRAAELEGDLVREHARAHSAGRRPIGQEPG